MPRPRRGPRYGVVAGSLGHRKAPGGPGMAASALQSGEEVTGVRVEGAERGGGAREGPGCLLTHSCAHLAWYRVSPVPSTSWNHWAGDIGTEVLGPHYPCWGTDLGAIHSSFSHALPLQPVATAPLDLTSCHPLLTHTSHSTRRALPKSPTSLSLCVEPELLLVIMGPGGCTPCPLIPSFPSLTRQR